MTPAIIKSKISDRGSLSHTTHWLKRVHRTRLLRTVTWRAFIYTSFNSVSNNRGYIAWNHWMNNVAYDVDESSTGLKWDTTGTCFEELRKTTKNLKTVQPTSCSIFQPTTSERALRHTTTTLIAVNNQLSYASIQNCIPGIPSACFCSIKLQTWHCAVGWWLQDCVTFTGTLSHHIHGVIWCTMHKVWHCEAYRQPCSPSLSKYGTEIQFLHQRKQCIFITGINYLHGNNRDVIISNTWNTQMHSAGEMERVWFQSMW
jgi:hypothetical protein